MHGEQHCVVLLEEGMTNLGCTEIESFGDVFDLQIVRIEMYYFNILEHSLGIRIN